MLLKEYLQIENFETLHDKQFSNIFLQISYKSLKLKMIETFLMMEKANEKYNAKTISKIWLYI